MNGVHDMGGMHGFGPIEIDPSEPLFHAAWEARVRSMMTLAYGRPYFTIDAMRYGIEQMPPAEYLRASYFERWLASLEYNLIHEGLLTRDELDARTALLREQPDAPLPPPTSASRAPDPPAPHPAPPPTARFAVGDAVVTRNVHPTGHTRLPRYARGKRGVVQRVDGPQIFPDTNAHGLGPQPRVLYNVRFDARELWGEAAEPHGTIALDLWESYLLSAPA
ncbi:MAG: nitrile hydratase subunit beta [Chloroflexi bacterium]|nr:nitrile hydratase subunit beta [Chloroflexota bacterium]